MKCLYVWNDLPLFFNGDLSYITYDLESFLNRVAKNKEYQCHFIQSKDFDEWFLKLSVEISGMPVMLIGTRPSKLTFGESNVFNYKLTREFDKNGATKGITECYPMDDMLLEWIKKYPDELIVVEDVLVNGITIDYICRKLKNYGYKGKIKFYIFCANSFSLELLQKQWGYQYRFEPYFHMEGKPIEESTLLCCYDLFYNKLGNTLYSERIDLLGSFLGESVFDLPGVIEQTKNKLKSMERKV